MNPDPRPSRKHAPPPPGPLPYARQFIDESDIAAVIAALHADFLTQGPTVGAFEEALCRTTGARHAVAVSSGSAALHLLAIALGVGPGQVGVTSPITFAATANCFLHAGGGVAFADVDPRTGLMTPGHLEAALDTLEARGVPPGLVIAVSLTGRVADLEGLARVCGRRGWTLVEDAAHSLGGLGRAADGTSFRSGSCRHTRAAILSFHPVKHICTGEGGAVLTNDADLAGRIRRLRSHGIDKPSPDRLPPGEGPWFQDQVELGFNYRLTDIQAALGLSQLRRLDAFLERRRTLARRYLERLDRPGLRDIFALPPPDEGSAWHLFVVHFADAALRRRAVEFLADRGIRTQVHYIPVYRHTFYKKRFGETTLPGAEAWYRGCLSLPLFPAMRDQDLERVADALEAFVRTCRL